MFAPLIVGGLLALEQKGLLDAKPVVERDLTPRRTRQYLFTAQWEVGLDRFEMEYRVRVRLQRTKQGVPVVRLRFFDMVASTRGQRTRHKGTLRELEDVPTARGWLYAPNFEEGPASIGLPLAGLYLPPLGKRRVLTVPSVPLPDGTMLETQTFDWEHARFRVVMRQPLPEGTRTVEVQTRLAGDGWTERCDGRVTQNGKSVAFLLTRG